jgi:putative membrane protein
MEGRRNLVSRALLVVAAALAAAVGTVRAEPDTNLDPATRQFFADAVSGSTMELAGGAFAVSKAERDDVKALGRQLMNDHARMNRDVIVLAKDLGDLLSNELRPDDRKVVDRLQKLDGAEFQREYLKAIVEHHTRELAMFEKQAASGTNPQVKAYAEKTLPQVKEHLRLAEEAAKGAAAGKGAAAPKAAKAAEVPEAAEAPGGGW